MGQVFDLAVRTPSGTVLHHTVSEVISIDGTPFTSFQVTELSNDKLLEKLNLLEAAFHHLSGRVDFWDESLKHAVVTKIEEDKEQK